MATTAATLSRTSRSQTSRLLRVAFLFMLPALLFVLIFKIIPIAVSFYYSLYSWDILDVTRRFVGLENFRRFFETPQAIGALRNTVLYAVVVSVAKNLAGLLIALALNKPFRSSRIMRVFILSGTMVSLVISGYTWSYILHPSLGLGPLLERLTGLGFLNQDWLGNPNLALYSVMIVSVWQITGKYMIIYLAGLQTVPVELYEAARIDGAGRFSQFSRITVPMIMPAITIGVMNAMIFSLKVFDEIFTMTKGGPGFASETLSTYLHSQAFFFTGRAGYASATAVILFFLVMAFSAVLLVFFRKKEADVYG